MLDFRRTLALCVCGALGAGVAAGAAACGDDERGVEIENATTGADTVTTRTGTVGTSTAP